MRHPRHARFLSSVFLALACCALASASYASGASHTSWRWMALKDPALSRCPQPGGMWKSEETFPNAARRSSLSRYCTLTFTGLGAPTLWHLQTLESTGRLLELAPDLMAVGPLSSPPGASLQTSLEAHFLEEAGAISQPPGLGLAPAVRLALLDSHPTSAAHPAFLGAISSHGATLLAMANQLLCGTADPLSNQCLARLTSRLALGHTSFSSTQSAAPHGTHSTTKGGLMGTIGELAEAIGDEIEDWENTEGDANLVLNLSVGWDPRLGGLEDQPAAMPVPVRAVYDALIDAACRGVLVIAASGNRDGGPNEGGGMMMPAAWSNRETPPPSACWSHGGSNGNRLSLSPRPLIYAAAGIQSSGAVLSNARPASVPERVAFADHGVVETYVPGAYSAILTGSSVASLVTSAAAAAAWHYDPSAKVSEIMRRVDDSGDVLDLRADQCFFASGGACQRVRRVSVCQSAELSCALSSGPCPAFNCPSWRSAAPSMLAGSGGLSSAGWSLDRIATPYAAGGVCAPVLPFFDPSIGPAADACPAQQYSSLESSAWVHPQPGSHPCPPCRVDRGSDQLYVEIDSGWTGALSSPTLEMCGKSYSLQGIHLQPGSVSIVDNVRLGACNQVSVSFTVQQNGLTYSSINSALIIN